MGAAAARDAKAVKSFPRPVAGALRPVVHGQTLRYQAKRRSGRGFTFEELKVRSRPAETPCLSVELRTQQAPLRLWQLGAAPGSSFRPSLSMPRLRLTAACNSR